METEYSLKFDESMTEDEIEQRSFRSLLPSEAHRRGNKDKSRHHEESEDDTASHSMALVPRTHNILKVRGQCGQSFVSINSFDSVFNNKNNKIISYIYVNLVSACFHPIILTLLLEFSFALFNYC